MKFKEFAQEIFSIKNECIGNKKYKVVKLIGLKIKFSCTKQSCANMQTLLDRYNKINKWPRYALRQEQIDNCKLISDRVKLLELMPKGAVCVEVGTATGEYAEKILEICKPEKIYLIDFWSLENADWENITRKRFKQEIESGQVIILKGDSADMLQKLEDKSIDFAYIDAFHDYEHPKNELNILKNKVKDKGYILGHDYTRVEIADCTQYGIIEAVNEFLYLNKEYELCYLTVDNLFTNQSYGLKKKL